MSTKQAAARFTFLLDPDLKQRFEELCAAQDITPSQLMRQMIKAQLQEHAKPARPQAAAPARKSKG
jgi:predicted transcriptional regulator